MAFRVTYAFSQSCTGKTRHLTRGKALYLLFKNNHG